MFLIKTTVKWKWNFLNIFKTLNTSSNSIEWYLIERNLNKFAIVREEHLIFLNIIIVGTYLSLYMLCVFCSFTPFLTAFFVFHKKDLVLWNLISRYMTPSSEQIFKCKDIVDLNVIQVAVVYAWQVVLIYIYKWKSMYWCLYVLCVFACVCDFKQSLVKTMSCVKPFVDLICCCIKHSVLLVLQHQGSISLGP